MVYSEFIVFVFAGFHSWVRFYLEERDGLLRVYCFVFEGFHSWVRFYLEDEGWFIEGLLSCICRLPQLGEVLPGGEEGFIEEFIVLYLQVSTAG